MASVKELMWDRLQVPTHAAENDTYQTDLYTSLKNYNHSSFHHQTHLSTGCVCCNDLLWTITDLIQSKQCLFFKKVLSVSCNFRSNTVSFQTKLVEWAHKCNLIILIPTTQVGMLLTWSDSGTSCIFESLWVKTLQNEAIIWPTSHPHRLLLRGSWYCQSSIELHQWCTQNVKSHTDYKSSSVTFRKTTPQLLSVCVQRRRKPRHPWRSKVRRQWLEQQ